MYVDAGDEADQQVARDVAGDGAIDALEDAPSRSSSVGPRARKKKCRILPPSSSRKNVIVRTVTSFTSAPKTPTVMSCSVPAASPSFEGSFFAWSLSFVEMSYLSSYLRNVWLLRRSWT